MNKTPKPHRVKVKLVAECEVEMTVYAEDGDDPADLTAEEEREAEGLGDSFPTWRVESVEEVT